MGQGPKEKKKINDPEKEKGDEKKKQLSEQKKLTNVPEDRPGNTDTSPERPDNPNPL